MKEKKLEKIFWCVKLFCFLFVLINCSGKAMAATVSDSSSDNTTASANALAIGDTISGSITQTDDLDYYCFELQSAGCVTLGMTSYMQYYCIKVYDSSGEEIWYTDYNEWTESVGYRKDTYNLYLEKGTYYMQVNGYKYGNSWKTTGKYIVATAYTPSGVSFSGDDNSFAAAKDVKMSVNYTGQISINDDYDTYKFQIPSSKMIAINTASYMKYYCIKIYDSLGEEIWCTEYNEWTESVGYRKDTYNLYLEKGTYYMQVNGYAYGNSQKSTGKYIISLEGLNQSNCNHDYSDTTVDATYFCKGYTLHKCSKCGKQYKDSYTDKRVLSQTYFYTWGMKASKKKVKLNWSTVSDASGYQIQYATNKKMKRAKTVKIKGGLRNKKTIKKLKSGKKYYFKIRAYKSESKKIVYAKWSKKFRVKVK